MGKLTFEKQSDNRILIKDESLEILGEIFLQKRDDQYYLDIYKVTVCFNSTDLFQIAEEIQRLNELLIKKG